jgi:aminomethyltransferase
MLKQTPLNRAHRALNAKLVDFGGWEMPLHYGSQIEEHHHVRRDSGMFDVSHMLVIDLAGTGARDFLRRLLANDVARLKAPGKALYACMLNEHGGVLDDLIVYFLGEDRYRMVVNAATAEGDLAWIESQRAELAPDVDILPRRDRAMIAVQGPNAREKFWTAFPGLRGDTEPLANFFGAASGDWFVARTGYTGEDGFEVLLPAAQAESMWQALLDVKVAPAGLGARDTLRLEAGMNLYGQDMDETVTPLECGLAWTVDLAPGREFIGRPALEGAKPQVQMLGLVLLERGVLRAHQKVATSHGDGEITSGTFSPTLGVSIALARLPSGVQTGEEVTVAVRDRRMRARTVKYPFVRHGKSLIGAVADRQS